MLSPVDARAELTRQDRWVLLAFICGKDSLVWDEGVPSHVVPRRGIFRFPECLDQLASCCQSGAT